ncbi:MAG: O-antigen ligase family protein [Elusimicrobia bacterium]|nr:O-antigen ligase family protein [Elusimicrobiota bacterium]
MPFLLFNRPQNYFFVSFILLYLFKGGREITGLTIYHISSIFLFLRFNPKFEFKKTAIDFPLFTFICACAFATLYSMFAQSRGLIHFATLFIHLLNFQLLLKMNIENFQEKFFDLIIWICSLSSVLIMVQNFLKIAPYFFLPNENLFSYFLNIGILSVISKIVFSGKNKNIKDNLKSSGLVIPLLLMLHVQLEFLSRGAFLSLFFSLAILLIGHFKKFIFPIFLTCLLFFSMLLITQNKTEALLTKFINPEEYSRITLWQSSLDAFYSKPFFGWGLGSFGQVYQLKKRPIEYDIARYEKTTRFAHNEFIQIAVEMGIIGLLSYVWLIFSILKYGFIPIKKEDDLNWERPAAFASFFSLLAQSLFDFNLHLPILALLFIFFTIVFLPLKYPENQFNPNIALKNEILGLNINSIYKKIYLKTLLITWLVIGITILISQTLFNLGYLLETKGKKEITISIYKLASALNPFNSEILKARNSIVENKSVKLLKQAILFNSKDDNLHAELARKYVVNGNYLEAIQSYEKAIKLNPKNCFYYSELAETYLLMKEIKPAFSLYQKSIQIEPFYILAHVRLGDCYLLKGDKNSALKFLKNALQIASADIKPSSPYSKRLLEFNMEIIKNKISDIKN